MILYGHNKQMFVGGLIVDLYRQQGEKYMGRINTETETVIKKILPYLKRRGYDVEQDFDFEIGLPQFQWL